VLAPRPGREAEHAAANRFFARERRLVWRPLMPGSARTRSSCSSRRRRPPPGRRRKGLGAGL